MCFGFFVFGGLGTDTAVIPKPRTTKLLYNIFWQKPKGILPMCYTLSEYTPLPSAVIMPNMGLPEYYV